MFCPKSKNQNQKDNSSCVSPCPSSAHWSNTAVPAPFFLFQAQPCSALHLDIQQWQCLFVFFSFFKSVRCYGIENQATSKDALPGWLETVIFLNGAW